MAQSAGVPDLAGVPHLVMLAPDSYRGRRIEILRDLTVGREATCDVRLDDPHVSRTHAALQRRGDTVFVQDLGSSGGTFVNGVPATRTELRAGDVVAFATVKARFEAPPPPAEETRAMPTQVMPPQARPTQVVSPPLPVPPMAVPPLPGPVQAVPLQAGPAQAVPPLPGPVQAVPLQAGPPLPGPVQPGPLPAGDGQKVPVARYIEPPPLAAERPMVPPTGHIQAVPAAYPAGRQGEVAGGGAGRDRYDAQLARRRDRLLRDAAATRTKARWLTWTGLLLFVVGAALFVAADLKLIKQVSKAIRSGTALPSSMGHLGRPIAGVPEGVLGWGIAALGTLLLVCGIVCHFRASARRRRVDREYPVPVP